MINQQVVGTIDLCYSGLKKNSSNSWDKKLL